MNEQQKFSDEFINAFVDDQLTPEEKAQVYARLSGNEPLSRQICELRKTRDLVQLAYKEPPMPARGMATLSAGRKIGLGVAAGLALAIIGGMVGWFLHQIVRERGIVRPGVGDAVKPQPMLLEPHLVFAGTA